ncbi:MAG: nucleotidyltransferase [Chloroflexi bacterium]|nr:nucleotidyltransferase [Chloroflexota bacterium]
MTRLNQHGVEFVIIGGMCGIMHGSTLVTTDLDVCCRFIPENLRRLEAAVKDLNPVHRLTANKLPFALTDELCHSLKNVYLRTDLGKLDCLGSVQGVGDYELVLKHSVVFQFSYGNFRILDLDTLITSKEAIGRARDLEAVRQLRAIKERNERRKT